MSRGRLPRLPTLVIILLLCTTFYFLRSSLDTVPDHIPSTITPKPVIPANIIAPPSPGGGGEPIKSPAEKALAAAEPAPKPVVDLPDTEKEKPVVPGAAPGAAAGVAGVGGPPRGDAAIDADLKDDTPPAHKGSSEKDDDSVTTPAKPKSKSKSPLTKDGSKPRIAIITITTKESTYTHLSLKDKTAYARKHGYDLIVDYELPKSEDNRVVWHKLVMTERMIKSGKYDWIWWIDFDTLITNRNIKLESLIEEGLKKSENPDKVDLILTTDCFPLNAGSMLIRATPTLLPFWSLVWKCGYADRSQSEQDCVKTLVALPNSPQKSRAVFLPQHKMNAFPEEIKCYGSDSRAWEEGDFVVHFAGAWAHVKSEDPYGELMRKYEVYVQGRDDEF